MLLRQLEDLVPFVFSQYFFGVVTFRHDEPVPTVTPDPEMPRLREADSLRDAPPHHVARIRCTVRVPE